MPQPEAREDASREFALSETAVNDEDDFMDDDIDAEVSSILVSEENRFSYGFRSWMTRWKTMTKMQRRPSHCRS